MHRLSYNLLHSSMVGHFAMTWHITKAHTQQIAMLLLGRPHVVPTFAIPVTDRSDPKLFTIADGSDPAYINACLDKCAFKIELATLSWGTN